MYVDNAPDLDEVYTVRAVTKHAVLQVDQNRSPEFPEESVTRLIAENSPSTTYVDVPLPRATDPDGGVLTYELTDDNDGLFQLVMVDDNGVPMDDGADPPMKGMPPTPVLQIRVAPLVADGVDANFGTEFDHEDEDLNSYVLEITVSDDGDHTDTLTVNIMVTDRNEAPETPRAAPLGPSISGAGSVDVEEGHTGMVATYSIRGSDATATWTLTGNDSSDFTLNRSTGELNFRATPDFGNPADADRNNTYEITVNAAIADGDPLSMDVTITVTDVMEPNRAPEFSAATAARSVEEGTAAGGNVGSPVTATDPDSGDTLTYALSGTDMASFTVDNMGQIMVGAGTMLDYETKASYMVTVTASDGIASDSIDVTVMVTAVGEMMGEVTLWAGAVPLTMAPQVGDPITGAVMDPDGGVTGATWQWARTMNMTD